MQSIRTIYAAHLSTCKTLGKPYAPLPNSTLNQKFNLFKNETPHSGEYPNTAYVAIGNKGATYELTSSNFMLTEPIPHLPRDAALYGHIPFVMRRTNNDLPQEERSKYRLRVPVTIGNVDYVAYYLRVLNLNETVPTVELRNVQDGAITTNPFEPSLGDLSPVAPDLSNVDVNNPNGDYLLSVAKVGFTLTQGDIANIMEACSIMFGDSRYAVINEIALCSGIDRTLQGTFGSTTSNYTEVVCAQTNVFVYQYHSLTDSASEINIRFDVGTSEPLLV